MKASSSASVVAHFVNDPLGGLPEPVQFSHSGVVGDQPTPVLMISTTGAGPVRVTVPPRGDHGGSGLVGGCGFDVGDDEVYGKYPNALVRFR